MVDRKRKDWSEAEVQALPSGEHEYFERKAGAILDDSQFELKLAKAISALANSGGGHLLLGVQNDGTFDGVPPIHKGRETTRDWIEQIIPNLLDYSLQDFRVHEVEPSAPSEIPAGRVVIVVDVGDSILAPHQSVKDRIYYLRAGGRSRPALHSYLERIRRQQNFPSKDVARAWMYGVINPLLGHLQTERALLDDCSGWDWNHVNHDTNQRGQYHSSPFKPLNSRGLYASDNQEQFIEYYPEIGKLFNRHDRTIKALDIALDNYVTAVQDSEALAAALRDSLSPEILETLRGQESIPLDATHEQILQALGLGKPSNEVIHILATMIVARLEQGAGYLIGPLWRARRQ